MGKIINDQFYTKKEVAEKCFLIIKNKYPELLKDSKILEPSAGTGSFIDIFLNNDIKKENILAFDIEPKHPLIKEYNFLDLTLNEKNLIANGNPPFGKRSRTAIDFVNHCSEFCHTIAFIVPVQFRKYSVQSKLNKDLKLIYDELLEPTSFENNGKDLNVISEKLLNKEET